MYCLIFLEAGSPRSRCLQVWTLQGLSPWHARSHTHTHTHTHRDGRCAGGCVFTDSSHDLSSEHAYLVSLCVSKFPLLDQDASPAGLGPILMASLELNPPFKGPISQCSHTLKYSGKLVLFFIRSRTCDKYRMTKHFVLRGGVVTPTSSS